MYAARIITASIIAASVIGCVSSGRTIDRAKVGAIRIGETSKDQVIAMFGAPFTQYYGPDGMLAMSWMHTRVGPIPGDIDIQNLSVKFDDTGLVRQYNLVDSRDN